ncbi:MAG: rhodanese-like domain-containing protein [Lapillicoccus sp.]
MSTLAALTAWETSLFSAPTRPATRPDTAGTSGARTVDDFVVEARSSYERISARAAYQLVLFRRAVLVDIRPEAQRRAEGEVHPALGPVVIERNVLEWRLDPRSSARLPWATAQTRVLVLCQEGYASSLAAATLVRLGVRATDVTGGLRAWREAGLPLVT